MLVTPKCYDTGFIHFFWLRVSLLFGKVCHLPLFALQNPCLFVCFTLTIVKICILLPLRSIKNSHQLQSELRQAFNAGRRALWSSTLGAGNIHWLSCVISRLENKILSLGKERSSHLMCSICIRPFKEGKYLGEQSSLGVSHQFAA